MAQAAQTPEQASIADGVTATFPISWTFGTSAEVRVSVDTGAGPVAKTEGVDYVLSGSNVVFQPGRIPPASARVARFRSTAVAQPEPFGDQSTFRPVANENAFDRLTRIAQENRARVGRGVSAPIGESGPELPPQAARDGGLALFDGAAMGSVKLVPGKVLGGDPASGRPVSVDPVFQVDVTPGTVASLFGAQASSFTALQQYVQTQGYLSAGDGGGGLYRRVVGEPAHPGKFQSDDGAWWELADERPNARQFGCVPGDGADCTTALNAALAAFEYLYLPIGDWRVDGTVTVPPGKVFDQAKHSTLSRLSAKSASTAPVLVVHGSYTRSTGGAVRTQNASPAGIAVVGHDSLADPTNALWSVLDGKVITGAGPAATNKGIVLLNAQAQLGDSTASYFHSVSNNVVSNVGIGIELHEMANAHQLLNNQFHGIGTSAYDFYGVLETKISGGFLHGGGVDGVYGVRLMRERPEKMANGHQHHSECNSIVGFHIEPGGASSKALRIEAGCRGNYVQIVDNAAGGSEILDDDNTILPAFGGLVLPTRATTIGPTRSGARITDSRAFSLGENATKVAFQTVLPFQGVKHVRVELLLRNGALGRNLSVLEEWRLTRSGSGTVVAEKVSGDSEPAAGPGGDLFEWLISADIAYGVIKTADNGTGTQNECSLSLELKTTAKAVAGDLLWL